MAKYAVKGPNMSKNKDLANKSVRDGNYTITYNENGYVKSAVKDGGKSATSTVKTTHANDSAAHQQAYQAAQRGDWDAVGNAINKIAIAGGKNQYGDYDMADANKYYRELVNEFNYNARDYYGVSDGVGSSGGGSYSDNMYQQALSMLQYAQKSAPTYANSYEGQLKEIYDKIVNRGKFQYDINSDMLYQQYKQQYQNNGRLAMQDTMGQAAALTGGYGSSYGQAVGQQQYDAYLQDLNDVIPELYSQAYQQYSDEGDKMIQQYSLLGDLADREYQQYSDDYDRWFAETQAALAQYNADRNFNYQKEQADRDYQFNLDKFNYSKEQADRDYQLALDKFAYQKQQDKKINQKPKPDPKPEPTYYNSLLGAISTAKGASSKGNYQTRSATYTESVKAINDALSAGKITKEEATALKRAAIPAAR